MKTPSCLLFSALVVLSGLSACSDPEKLGDREALRVIQDKWNEPDVGLVLGEVKFVSRRSNLAKGRDLISEWSLYQAFADQGIITVSDERDLTKKFSGWSDWLSLSQSGVRKTATIGLAEGGDSAGVLKRTEDIETLSIKVAETRVEDIVSNEEQIVGTDRYRVVLGTHLYDVPEEMSAAFEASRGWDHNRERRFKALLKYDPFEKRWSMVAWDISGRDEEFETDHVGQTLQSLRLGLN